MTNETLGKEWEVSTFACTSCGGDLKYRPGTISLTCEHCGAENEIPQIDTDFEELTRKIHYLLIKKGCKGLSLLM